MTKLKDVRPRTSTMGNEQFDCDVLMVPWLGSYTDEIVKALEEQGATVRTSKGLFRIVTGIYDGGKPDVLHLHFIHEFFLLDSKVLSFVLGIRLLVELCIAKILGVKVVWTVHNLYAHDSAHPKLERVFRHLTTYFCDSVVVHCDTATDIIIEEYRLPPNVRDNIETVPHANFTRKYPNEITSKEARAELDVDADEFVFLFFGQIRRYKQVDKLIHAFKQFDADGVRLLIIGKPVDDDFVDRISTLCKDDDRIQTEFEFVPDEEVQLYMQAADVVVLPYRSILTSGSLLLAMTFAKPVIAPDLGCVGELLDAEGGYPYDPDSADGLSTALQQAASRSLDGMGQYNYAKIRHLDWDVIARETLQVYNC